MSILTDIRLKLKSCGVSDLFKEYGDAIRGIESDAIYSQIGHLLTKNQPQGTDYYKIALLSNFTIHTFANMLTVNLASEGICSNIYISEYSQYESDLFDHESEIYSGKYLVSMLLLDDHVISDRLGDDWSLENIQFQSTLLQKQIEAYISTYRLKSGAVFVISTIPLSLKLQNHFIDYSSRSKLRKIWNTLNNAIIDFSDKYNDVVIIDSESILQSECTLVDDSMYYYAKQYFSDKLLRKFSNELTKVVLAIQGKNKKCLIVDLDNTLWDGILGDDGWNGVEFDSIKYGHVFLDMHRLLKQWSRQGLLLAVASKNDESTFSQLIENRSDFALSKDDFVGMYVNWEPKSINISKLSSVLNISTDSMVFLDDSSFEQSEVRENISNVTVLPANDNPMLYPRMLFESGMFEVLMTNSEDYNRVSMYHAEASRLEVMNQASCLEEFLKNLDMKLEISIAKSGDYTRIAQLTARTNQFNLNKEEQSTDRLVKYSENNVILKIVYEDKFGSNGIVGCMLLKVTNETESTAVIIENFILSCKVFSRGIEKATLQVVTKEIKRHGNVIIKAFYRENNKNKRYNDFYAKNGFVTLDNINDLCIYQYMSDPECDFTTMFLLRENIDLSTLLEKQRELLDG